MKSTIFYYMPDGEDVSVISDGIEAQTDTTKLTLADTVYVSPDAGATNEAFPKQGVEYDFCVDVINLGDLTSGSFLVRFTLSGDQNPPFVQDFQQEAGLDPGGSVKAVVYFGSFPNTFATYFLEACVYDPSMPDAAITCAGTFEFSVNTESVATSDSSEEPEGANTSDIENTFTEESASVNDETFSDSDTSSEEGADDANFPSGASDAQELGANAVDAEGFKLLDGGTWNGSANLKCPGGQVMHFEVKNVNVLGTTITINSNLGGSKSLIIGPTQTSDIRFDCFGREPTGWVFDISSDSDAFIVAWKLYSSWTPDDPFNG